MSGPGPSRGSWNCWKSLNEKEANDAFEKDHGDFKKLRPNSWGYNAFKYFFIRGVMFAITRITDEQNARDRDAMDRRSSASDSPPVDTLPDTEAR